MAERRRGWRWGLFGGLALAGLVLLAILTLPWWIKPVVEARAAIALGRPVAIGRLHIRPGSLIDLAATDIVLGNPPGFPAEEPFARIGRLELQLDLLHWLRHRQLVLPLVLLQQPQVQAVALADGRNNYSLGLAVDPAGEASDAEVAATGPRIGALRIEDGTARLALAPLRADFQLRIATREEAGQEPQILVEADGRYADQPMQGQLVGGALLNLRDADHPWPVHLTLRNGPTTAELRGTLQDPLQLRGAALTLRFAGPDMALLEPLTAIPFPRTPAYQVAGKLDYADHRARFTDIRGRMGHSDIAGDVMVTPGQDRPDVVAALRSRSLDLADLAGFIGAPPPGTPEARAAAASPRLLPSDPINLPKLLSADIHLDYRAGHIQGRAQPLDDFAVKAEIVNGEVRLQPLSFGVGRGRIVAEVSLAPRDHRQVQGRADIRFDRLDLARLMAVSGGFQGAGTVTGRAVVEGGGASLAQILGGGNGGLVLSMAGGDLSKLLVDLSGLRFGEAMLAALGLPSRTQVQCFVADMVLQRGVLFSRALLLETEGTVTEGEGGMNLARETVNLLLRTESKRFTVGALPAPILVQGTLRNPSIAPDAGELALRGGIAGALAAIAPPLAALPLTQLGSGDDPRCERLVRRARR